MDSNDTFVPPDVAKSSIVAECNESAALTVHWKTHRANETLKKTVRNILRATRFLFPRNEDCIQTIPNSVMLTIPRKITGINGTNPFQEG
mmetsp:Transcript_8785/g.14235  ORF Transcript_8785/g.14235 Transcript_8785/m.14235 type:complete len:90 (-) Transcript_8785:2039-2308(-)|eukprot:jgi/Bigna1/64822/fgenesh1_kg.86_\